MSENRQVGDEVWRIHWLTRWVFTAVMLALAGYGVVVVWESPIPYPSVGFLLICGLWAWLIVWRPKAIVRPDELVVVDRIRRQRLTFDDRFKLVHGTTFVTFESETGRRVRVTAMPVKYLFRWLLPWAFQHQERFASAVESAQNRFREQKEVT